MLQIIHAFGGEDAGFDFMKKLQDNNVGPSASTGKLTALVNKGELHVANGDLQMNMSQMADNPNIKVFWPAGPDGKRSTFALPYYIGLVTGAPNADNGKKLIDFLLSKEAQSTVSSVALGMPARKDVTPTDANFAKAAGCDEGRDHLDAELGRGAERSCPTTSRSGTRRPEADLRGTRSGGPAMSVPPLRDAVSWTSTPRKFAAPVPMSTSTRSASPMARMSSCIR